MALDTPAGISGGTDTETDTGAGPGERNAGLSARRLAGVRELLEEQRQFRLEQLERLRTYGTGLEGPATEGPQGGRERLVSWARMVLTDVDDALDRIAGGRYGSCESCDGGIEWDRLRMVPQARFCSRCQFGRRDAARRGTGVRR